jgi:hypothetical protein
MTSHRPMIYPWLNGRRFWHTSGQIRKSDRVAMQGQKQNVVFNGKVNSHSRPALQHALPGVLDALKVQVMKEAKDKL